MANKVVRITDNVNPTFKEVWTTDKVHNILRGGRGSFKSSVISLKLVYEMTKLIKQGKVGNVIVIRRTATSLRHSVVKQIEWALMLFGVYGQYTIRYSPLTITHNVTGSTFYFYGSDDVDKLKSNTVKDIIGVWYEEATDFRGYEDFDQNFATFARNASDDVSNLLVFYSYNPPRNPYSWINEWADSLIGEDNYLVHHSTYLDDELGFTRPEILDEIERIKRNDHDYYRFMYLGEAVGLGTNIYNLNLINVIDELPSDDPIIDVYYSADIGHQTSATAVLCFGVSAKRNVYLIDIYYYSPENKARKKSPSELAEDVYEFVKEKGYNVRGYTIDSAEGGFRNQYYNDFGIRWKGVAKQKKHIMIDFTHDLLAQGRFFVLKNERNQIFLDEAKRYEWDIHTTAGENPQPVAVHDHSLDAFQYFVTDNLRRLGLKR